MLPGLFSVALSFALAPLMGWIALRLTARLTGIDNALQHLREGNAAVALVVGAMILASGRIVAEVLTPTIVALRMALGPGGGFAEWAVHAIGQISTSLAIAVSAMALMYAVFSRLTPGVDERSELERGNVAVGLVLAAVLCVGGAMLAEGIAPLLEALVPYPDAVTLRVAE